MRPRLQAALTLINVAILSVLCMAQMQITGLPSYLLGITAGTGAASKVLVPDASGNITVPGLIRLVGATSSFPALKRSGGNIDVRAADDSAQTRMDMSALQLGGVLALSSGTPTISSGFGTTPSVASGKAYAFTVNVGTGGTASAGVIGMPTASNGWNCKVENQTGVAANRADQRTVQTASTTTTVSVQNQTISTGAALAWTASDILALSCTGR